MPEINHKIESPISTPSGADLEKQIKAILAKTAQERVEAAQPKEPDWATLTERDACNPAIYIPVIDHAIPDYMNMKLKDPEYEVVWANKDQRRVGQLQAEGYELLKKDHVHPSFKLPLLFNSEGLYEYQDVIAMRVHKRILYGKRRRGLDLSQQQLRNNRRPPSTRIKDTFDLSGTPSPEFGTFYDPMV